MNYINLCVLLGANFAFVFSNSNAPAGPPGPIKFYQIRNCDPDINKIKFQGSFVEGTDKSTALSLSFDLPIDVDSSLLMNISVSKWENNQWVHDYWCLKNEAVLTFLQNHLKRIYDKIRNQAVPKIDDSFSVKKGPRELNFFQATSTEIGLPQTIYGRYLAELVLNFKGEDYLCVKVELEMFPPEVVPSSLPRVG